MKKICIGLAFTVAMCAFVACGQDNKEAKYNDACALIESGDYEGAYAAFKELGNYKDSKKHLSRFIYFPTAVNYDLGDRSGVMTVELGAYNMPTRMLTQGVEGEEDKPYTKDGVYTYDSVGNLLRQAMTYNGTLMAYDYTYDNENRLIKAEYSTEGVVSAVNTYVYDENGFLIREDYIADGVVYYDYVNSYDANGNLIKSVFNAEEGDHIYIYTYSDEGNLVKETGTLPDGYYYNVDYTYNADGELTQKVCTEEGEHSYTTNYTYDNVGNCIKEENIYPDETKDVYTREYDANGNLTKETLTTADGTLRTVDSQYALTYLTIDIPVATMNQIIGIFDIL